MKRLVISVPGFMAVAIYVIFTAVSMSKYPDVYSPFMNWLSDLGNPLANPSGAFFYNLGCILTSLILLAFFVGLRYWVNNHTRLNVLLTIAQIAGILSSIFLIVTALFPLGSHTSVHAISGKIHIIFLGFFLTLSATVILKHPNLRKWPAYFGFIAAVINFIYGAFMHSVFVAEWIAIGMFIVYVLIISSNSLPVKNEQMPLSYER